MTIKSIEDDLGGPPRDEIPICTGCHYRHSEHVSCDEDAESDGRGEPCDECSGSRFPVEEHDEHCSLHEAV